MTGSDDITVRGGGQVAIASSHLLELAQVYARAAVRLEQNRAEVAAINRRVHASELTVVDSPHSAYEAESRMIDAAAALHQAALAFAALRAALTLAADGYGLTERTTERLLQDLMGRVGWFVGALLPRLIAQNLPAAMLAGVGAFAAWSLLPPKAQRAVSAAVLSDPAFVAGLRLAIGSADDFALGVGGIPPELAHLLGDEGLRVTGLASTTAGILAVARPWWNETPCEITRVTTRPAVAPPANFEERADRLPHGGDQIRIDRYGGEPPRFDIYIAGTITFDLANQTETSDMKSNLYGVAGNDSAAERAVREAMQSAGIREGDRVIFNGYSQGALIAARLAGSGDYATAGLFTVGGPIGQIEVPPNVPWLVVEHTDDLVPALGGAHLTNDAVIVSRRALEPGRTNDFAVPAHDIREYAKTLALVDTSREQRVSDIAETFRDFGGADRAESTTYRAART